MADKDEAEPTDESSAALPADARDDAAAASEAAATRLPADESVDLEPTDELADPATDDGSEPEDLTEPEDPDARLRRDRAQFRGQ